MMKIPPVFPKSIAIVGGGLSGLSTAYNFVKQGISVVVIDPSNSPLSRTMKENSASVVAAGLMHPFSPSGSLMWMGRECYDDSIKLVHEVEKLTGNRYVK